MAIRIGTTLCTFFGVGDRECLSGLMDTRNISCQWMSNVSPTAVLSVFLTTEIGPLLRRKNRSKVFVKRSAPETFGRRLWTVTQQQNGGSCHVIEYGSECI